MQRRFRCVDGHEWAQGPDQTQAVCPVCGASSVEIQACEMLDATLDAPKTHAQTEQNEFGPPQLRQAERPAHYAEFEVPEDTKHLVCPETTGELSPRNTTPQLAPSDATIDQPPPDPILDEPADEKTESDDLRAHQGSSQSNPSDQTSWFPAPVVEETLERPDVVSESQEMSATPYVPLAPLEKGGPFHQDTYLEELSAPTRSKVGIPGYEIIRELGRGGMGVVYQAKQTRLNRMTALKMILSGAHASPKELARFRSEGQAVAALHHPNIVQIYEVGEHDGRPYFSLEFVDGGTLSDKLQGTPLAPREVARTMQKLADAMDFAHKKNIIHRDLKPANVLLTQDNEPKITDFGLAKSLDDDSGQTGTGAILGTPSYMSPEQAKGLTKSIGPAADIYSLGAMFYDMLTGRPPFRGQTVLDTLQQVQKVEPVPPRRLQPDVPRDLEVICLKCLQKEPEKRYSSAGELARDLQRFLNNEPIQARPVSSYEHAWKWARRNPVVASLIVGLCVVLVGGLMGITALWLKADFERRAAITARNLAKKNAEIAVTNEAEAQAQKLKAEDNAKKALVAENAAKKSAQQAMRAKKVALDNYQKARRNLYVKQVASAQDELARGRRNRAKQILAQLTKHTEGEVDLRSFEWFYLNRLCTSEKLQLRGHVEKVTQVAFSSDGQWVASAGLDRMIKLWDVESGTVLKTLVGHTRPIRAISFAPDDSFLASAAAGGKIILWDPQLGTKLREITAHNRSVRGVAVSPDGSRLASCSDDRTVKLWTVKTGALIRTLNQDGQWHKYPVACLAFDRKGQFLAAGDEGRLIHIWDLASGEVDLTLRGHKHWLSCLAFHKDGKTLASGSWDRTVRIWDMAQKKKPLVLRGHKHTLQAVAFNPEAPKLASVDATNTVKVWDLQNPVDPQTLEGNPTSVRTVSFSRDGQFLAAVRFTLPKENTNPIVKLHKGPVMCLGLYPDGKTAVSGGTGVDANGETNGELVFWDVASQKPSGRITIPNEPVRVIAVAPKRDLIAIGTEETKLHLVVPGQPSQKALLDRHTQRILSLDFDPSGKFLASSGADSIIHVWDVMKRKHKFELTGHKGPVRCVRFSSDGQFVASASVDRTIRIWDAKSGKLIHELKDHEAEVNALAFHPKSNLLASGSADDVIFLWDVTSGKRKASLRGHDDAILSLTFSPDGKRLASGSADRLVKLWDVEVGLSTLTVQGHTGSVTSLVFTPDNTRLLSASEDQTIRILEAPPAKK
ncbi:MAG: protein kinase [Gemmataceae bacterium]